MLNLYHYYDKPSDLNQQGYDQLQTEYNAKVKDFESDLYELQDSYDVNITHHPNTNKFTVKWNGRLEHGTMNIEIPENRLIAQFMDRVGSIESTHDLDEVISILKHELDMAHAFYNDEEENDEEEDENWDYDEEDENYH